MAKTLQFTSYVGTPHSRVIRASDFKSMDVGANDDKVSWEPKNKHVAEVSDEAAAWLLENEAGDWKDVTKSGSTGEDVDGESSSSSESAEDDDALTDEGDAPITTGARRTRRS
jgi:hypothetical protein